MTTEQSPDRRRFLGNAAALAAGITIAPGVTLYGVAQAKPLDQPVTNTVRWGMLIDANRCADGCTDCVTACNTENGLNGHGRPETDAQWIRKVNLRDPKTGAKKSLPVLCMHCAEPPCVDVCPTGASFKRDDGIVLVDKHTCIGCRYCMLACPYKARSFIHETLTDQVPHTPRGKGTVESCTFCVHRVDDDRSPACVEACSKTTGALTFGDMNNPNSKISKALAEYPTSRIRADLGTEPGVRYRGL
ncbi:MAG: 4Fe-4S dicluster domain-containing protein [Rhodospirillales bacterium]|nr:4Fe-4S dicluster domain-containing protein [Rhodospirillales bacterium]